MPIKHIVLLKFKTDISQIEVNNIIQSLASLKKQIPEIMSFTWGKNTSPENLNRGYTHGFIVEFKNSADRKIYLEHPDHINVVNELFLPALIDRDDSLIVFDYETQ